VIAALEPCGYTLVEAVDGQAALNTAAVCAPDVIVTDLLMPNLDGFGLLRELRSRGSQTPVIVLSAEFDDRTQELCRELGVAAFVSKPFQSQHLSELVRESVSALALQE
jgi:CheY-like chemotaxis protein